MELITIIVFLALIISAPWISRKWGFYGNLVWGIITMAYLILVMLISN